MGVSPRNSKSINSNWVWTAINERNWNGLKENDTQKIKPSVKKQLPVKYNKVDLMAKSWQLSCWH